MTREYSLAFLTCWSVAPDVAVEIAAEAGYDAVGLRLLPAAPGEKAPAIMTDKALQERVSEALRHHNVRLADIEIARLGHATDIHQFEPFLDLGAKFGAKNILVAGDDDDHESLSRLFGAFCDLAAPYGLTADLEFMPWTGVKTLSQARSVVERADRSNGGVLIDALHWDRSGGTTAEVADMPPALLNYAQLCDGRKPFDPSTEAMIEIARGHRLPPGDGDIDLTGLVNALPETLTLSIEVPNAEISGRDEVFQWAERNLRQAKHLIA
ncbi:sugar phosphate isomerase/epimerase [Notoacmeibacter sp. MSK16QG-6]|uniref:sugar phosphate isomerase/epimerase family protein n=1 Tax=Notoacmeibacter sp. MSK16QG-6 TaxID=2957982 RepID=UPI00209E4906|nr:sugar phosphate isomerase/epimerase [Notoacmeibacter sp. MSK16QG-6]MCP1198323.1 sugar phosphate isomerase/epimerase [Notoacmeibacter sp. MSK16QG-6]